MNCPYPKELESEIRLPSGRTMSVRAIKPDDEPALQLMIERLDVIDSRWRFFHVVKSLSHTAAASFCQIDYDRQMALVVEDGNGLAGVARYYSAPDLAQAEFAILVRSDLKRRGIGTALLNMLIDVARRRGIGALVGDVMNENASMRGLCLSLGLRAERHPDDPALSRMRIQLKPRSADRSLMSCRGPEREH
jgi:acetyltransferase